MLKPGLYEQVISKQLRLELEKATDKLQSTAPIDSAEASKVLAKYITEIIEKGFDNVKDNGGDVQSQIELANKIVTTEVIINFGYDMAEHKPKFVVAMDATQPNSAFIRKSFN